jgi:tetratricopeptide (TPR) repeat protein
MKIETLARACSGLAQSGRLQTLGPTVEYTMKLADSVPDLDAVTRSSVSQMVGFAAGQTGDPYDVVVEASEMIEMLERMGNLRRAAAIRNTLGVILARIGELEPGMRHLRKAAADAGRIGAYHTQALAEHNLCLALRLGKQYDESIKIGQRALETFLRQGNRRLAGATRIYLCETCNDRGEFARAESEAREALQLVDGSFNLEMDAYALLGRTLLAVGRADEALVEADRALERHAHVTGIRKFVARPYLVKAEVLAALGRTEEARKLLEHSEQLATATLSRILDETHRNNVRDASEEWREIRALRTRLG